MKAVVDGNAQARSHHCVGRVRIVGVDPHRRRDFVPGKKIINVAAVMCPRINERLIGLVFGADRGAFRQRMIGRQPDDEFRVKEREKVAVIGVL